MGRGTWPGSPYGNPTPPSERARDASRSERPAVDAIAAPATLGGMARIGLSAHTASTPSRR